MGNNHYLQQREREYEEEKERELWAGFGSDSNSSADGSNFIFLIKLGFFAIIVWIIIAICYFAYNSIVMARADVAFGAKNYLSAYEGYASIKPQEILHKNLEFFNFSQKANDKKAILLDAVFEEYNLVYPTVPASDVSTALTDVMACGVTDAGELDVSTIPNYPEKFAAINTIVSDIQEAALATDKSFMIITDSSHTVYTFATASSTFVTNQIKGTDLYYGETFEDVAYFKYFSGVLFVKHLDGTWTVSNKANSFSQLDKLDMAEIEDILTPQIFKKPMALTCL